MQNDESNKLINLNEIRRQDSKETGESSIEPSELIKDNSEENTRREINCTSSNLTENQPATSKDTFPCPFLFRRGRCAKGDHCDFSHSSYNNELCNISNLPKYLVPCPFLKRGFV